MLIIFTVLSQYTYEVGDVSNRISNTIYSAIPEHTQPSDVLPSHCFSQKAPGKCASLVHGASSKGNLLLVG